MNWFKTAIFALFSLVMLTLAGCGSSNSGSTTDPFAGSPPVVKEPDEISGGERKVTVTLTTDRDVYDIVNKTIIATAKVQRDGVPVYGAPVTFSVHSGTVTVGYATPITDTNGVSVGTLTASSAEATENVIIKATATIEGTPYFGYAQFKVNGYDPTAEPTPTLIVTLTADETQVDVDNGTVLLNANLIYGTDYLVPTTDGSRNYVTRGSYISDHAVDFTVISGPATITGSTQRTDNNGNVQAILTTGNEPITTNVIVEASTMFDGFPFRGRTTIQIVRGGGVIMFTSSAGTDPGGQVNLLPAMEKEVDASLSPSWDFLQLIPFKVTDSNGNPRVGVPVTISVYSITTMNPGDVKIDFLVPPVTEQSQQTITSDSAGQGIFNVRIRMATPPPSGANAVNVVFKAVTNDAIPVTAYVGGTYELQSKPPKEEP